METSTLSEPTIWRGAIFNNFQTPVTWNCSWEKKVTVVHYSSSSTQVPRFITIAHFMSEKIDSTFCWFLLIWPNSLSSGSCDQGLEKKSTILLLSEEGQRTIFSMILSTDLHVKSTDTLQFLHSDSCHPNHTKKGIAYVQALRIKRIYSAPDTAKLRCSQLEDYLALRGHSRHRVRSSIDRALKVEVSPFLPHMKLVQYLYFSLTIQGALISKQHSNYILFWWIPIFWRQFSCPSLVVFPPT